MFYTKRVFLPLRVSTQVLVLHTDIVFALLLLRLRVRAVREMLNQHCVLEDTDESREKELFLVDKLLIPEQWIHNAKAIRARREGDKHLEALHLYKAGEWNHCHRLVIQHLASGLYICGSCVMSKILGQEVGQSFKKLCLVTLI